MITQEELTIIINGLRRKYRREFIKGPRGETPIMSSHDPEGDPLKWRDYFFTSDAEVYFRR